MSYCEDESFRQRLYMTCVIIAAHNGNKIPMQKFKFRLNEKTVYNMKHALEIFGCKTIRNYETVRLIRRFGE
jgi:hypothetical protein